MVSNTKVILVDDVNGEDAAETVSFALDGAQYEIDLSAEHAADLRSSIAKYVDHARRVSGRKKVAPVSGDQPHEIRAWAQNNGFTVSQRGRVSKTVINAYRDAQR